VQIEYLFHSKKIIFFIVFIIFIFLFNFFFRKKIFLKKKVRIIFVLGLDKSGSCSYVSAMCNGRIRAHVVLVEKCLEKFDFENVFEKDFFLFCESFN